MNKKMPELAEAEYYRKQWPVKKDDPIREVLLQSKARVFRETAPRAISKFLYGERLLEGYTHGKQILFRFSSGNWLGVHLGMSGHLWSNRKREWEPAKHDHLVLRGKRTDWVFTDPRMFGKIVFDRCEDFPPWWKSLPPGVLDDAFTASLVSDFLARFSKSPVKTVLLDQRCFPGIGNWMADEICWRLQLNPAVRCGELNESAIRKLRNKVRVVSRRALAIIGEDWGTPPRTWLFQHRWKDGGVCPRRGCGTALQRSNLRGRTTCWCPACQR